MSENALKPASHVALPDVAAYEDDVSDLSPRQRVYAYRLLLSTIQRREPHHARIGATLANPRPTASGETVHYRGTLATECPRCPSRRDCERASLGLAEVDTMVISGGAHGQESRSNAECGRWHLSNEEKR